MSNEKDYNNLEEVLNDTQSYLKYCIKCESNEYFKEGKCLKCMRKKGSLIEVKPYDDRFLANDPIDW